MARLVLGVGVSALFVALTLARVDLAAVADALRAAAPLGVLAAFAIVLLDFGIRTIRWKLLLDGLEGRPPTVGLRTVAAYLSIGYLGNASLPARLGDLARAYLAGLAFGISRATILGTIVVERVADGATMLGLAVFSSLLVNVGEVRALAAAATGLAIVAVAALGAILLVVSRGNLARWTYLSPVREAASRLAAGIAGIRTIRGATRVGGVTVAAAATAVWLGWVVAGAAGIALTPLQAILFSSGIALSLAIPAAPASVGTFEFAGVVILSTFGATPEQALASMLILRLVSTIPLSLLGLGSIWVLHVRPVALFRQAGAPIFAPEGEAKPPAMTEPAVRGSEWLGP